MKKTQDSRWPILSTLNVSVRVNHKKYWGRISQIPVQLLSRVRLFATPWTTAHQASLSITNSRSPPKPMSIESVMPSNYLILCCPLLLLPSIFPSIKAFSNDSALCIKWPKYWGFSFNISPSNEHPGLISFRMDWVDLLAVQGTLKSLLKHHTLAVTIFIHALTHSMFNKLLKSTLHCDKWWARKAHPELTETGCTTSRSRSLHPLSPGLRDLLTETAESDSSV